MLILRHATRRLALSLLLVTLSPSLAAAAPGDLDTTFGEDGWEQTDIRGTGGSDWGADAALQADGKIVVVGSSQAGDYADFALARYNPDGTLDATFGDGGIVITPVSSRNDEASGVAIQADGAIVVAGGAWVGARRRWVFALVRYLADGTLDPAFGGDGIVLTNFTPRNDYARAVTIQANGKIVAVGHAAHQRDFAIARYTATGIRDRSFSGDGRKTVNLYSGPTFPPGGSNDSATDVAIQVNGKIVVSGSTAWRWNNRVQTRLSILRLRSGGALDPAFSEDGKTLTRTQMPFPVSGGLALQPDGKIVAGGTAGFVFLLVRLRQDGSKDPTFSQDGVQRIDVPGSGDGCDIDFGVDLAIQPDGKLVQAGFSQPCEGSHVVGLVRVHADGSTDTSFGDAGTVVTSFGDASDRASSVMVQADGRILIAGTTTTAPSTDDFLVARYLS